MRVIPVLDVRGGIAVRARRGDRARYRPLESRLAPGAAGDAPRIAAAYRTVMGLDTLYVADLDAIGGGAVQSAAIGMLAAGACTWVDAGIDDVARALRVAGLGAARVIVGLETLASRAALRAIVHALGGERVAFSVDLYEGRARAADVGLAALTPAALARLAADEGAGTVIVLDLSRVGTCSGVDHRLAELLVRGRGADSVELVMGGGITGAGEIRALAATGVDGVLVASALHDGRMGAAEIASLNTV